MNRGVGEWMGGWLEGWVGGEKGKWTDSRMDVQRDVWTGRGMDRQTGLLGHANSPAQFSCHSQYNLCQLPTASISPTGQHLLR